jgi:FkbM family methyltransferase
MMAELLSDSDLSDGIYVDVGANQPTHISNTYLFYRRGLSGILIEPERENCWLLSHFRPRDQVIRAVASSKPGVCPFYFSVYSVLSSMDQIRAADLLRREYVARITLDDLVRGIEPRWIFLLSVDTEGHDLEVLKGATVALRQTCLVCAESDRESNTAALRGFMNGQGFDEAFETGRNHVFRNRAPLVALKEAARSAAIEK